MDPLDATPDLAARAGYAWVRLSHCGHIVLIPTRMLPARRLRDMRFRCERCGVLLEAEHANARWTWQYEGCAGWRGPKPRPWAEVT